MENGDEDEEECVEMAAIATNSSSASDDDGEHSFESDGSFSSADIDTSEYGEHTLAPQTVTKDSPVAQNNDFYRASVHRQNRCFGASMVAIAGSFLVVYLLMDVSFSPSNIGIFGDESSMRGGSGEVGLDAENAETQEIVDEEIIAVEEAGHWGDLGKTKTAKRTKDFEDRFRHSKVGENKWVEEKDWWKKNSEHIDTSNMSKKQKKDYEHVTNQFKNKKKKKKHCRRNPNDPVCQHDANDTDLEFIQDKLAEHFNYDSTGREKESFAAPMEGSGRDKGKKHHHNHKNDQKHKKDNNDNTGSKEEKDLTAIVEESPDDNNNKEENDMVTEKGISDGDSGEEGAEDSVKEEEEAGESEEIQDINDNEEEENGVATKEVVPESDDGEEHAEDPVGQEEDAESKAIKSIASSFTVLGKFHHDSSSFTQGLSYGVDGTIYETTGLYGKSKVRKINPDTFEVELSVDIDAKYFGEGSTFYIDADGNERLIVITWREQTGFIYDAKTLEKLEEFKYTTTPGRYRNEGWGLTYDPSMKEFIVSDGSDSLYFWDRDTLEEKRKISVTRFNGKGVQQLNELEFIDGLVCMNIWHRDDIICVDPVTGNSVREYDMSSLWPANQRGNSENVLNGIALGKDHILLTGKRWDRMYKIVFPDWPMLFENNENNHDAIDENSTHDKRERDEVVEDAAVIKVQNSIINTFTVLDQVSHDPTSFTQGLSYGMDGTLFETTGLYRQSKVRRINPDTFDVELSVDINGSYFGEGSTFYTDANGDERLVVITWREQKGFIYDTNTLEKLEEFSYTTTPEQGNQGWGITYNPSAKEFIVSDGSKYLYFWDRDTLAEKRKVAVTRFDGNEQTQLNELEFMDGLVCMNLWHSDDIICVDPVTGKSVREYDMSSLWPANERGNTENVLNGIALGIDHVLLTGKRWDRMYKVVFPDWTTLFG